MDEEDEQEGQDDVISQGEEERSRGSDESDEEGNQRENGDGENPDSQENSPDGNFTIDVQKDSEDGAGGIQTADKALIPNKVFSSSSSNLIGDKESRPQSATNVIDFENTKTSINFEKTGGFSNV